MVCILLEKIFITTLYFVNYIKYEEVVGNLLMEIIKRLLFIKSPLINKNMEMFIILTIFKEYIKNIYISVYRWFFFEFVFSLVSL